MPSPSKTTPSIYNNDSVISKPSNVWCFYVKILSKCRNTQQSWLESIMWCGSVSSSTGTVVTYKSNGIKFRYNWETPSRSLDALFLTYVDGEIVSVVWALPFKKISIELRMHDGHMPFHHDTSLPEMQGARVEEKLNHKREFHFMIHVLEDYSKLNKLSRNIRLFLKLIKY